MAGFSLHALSVGGGVLAISPMPGRGAAYDMDLDHMAEWKPSIVMSLTTSGEMVDHGAETLGADFRARAARWVHLPVPDFGVPDKAFEAAWPAAAEAALLALKGGGRVLIHCMGGCGRSGMAALRLMVEAGEPVDQALGRLRAVRPCAVETDGQFEWAKAGHRRKLPRPGGVCR
ncbi:cyclin-dependent kinase inhibitor 3 family protein [Cognatishimia sp. WU-CL00825]|uniref:protein-tyrosine phosphatase family protein n=1 Tax=Cognatishimia sp. WU-CL00825 TaxID=3127658 RepID=UPI0031054BE3